jgi:hypothetical protein
MVSAQDKTNARQIAGLSRTVRAGFAYHQAGRLERAETLYRKALERTLITPMRCTSLASSPINPDKSRRRSN